MYTHVWKICGFLRTLIVSQIVNCFLSSFSFQLLSKLLELLNTFFNSNRHSKTSNSFLIWITLSLNYPCHHTEVTTTNHLWPIFKLMHMSHDKLLRRKYGKASSTCFTSVCLHDLYNCCKVALENRHKSYFQFLDFLLSA